MLVSALILPPALNAQGADAQVASLLARSEPEWIALRRDLHQHPELSGAETRTAGIVAARLRALGLEVRTEVGGHGVVALLRGGRPGPVVAYRADMDAVSDPSPDPVEFASLTPGVRHICGHDLHTTIGLAIAAALAAVRSEIAGSVLFIFQPAEERATGARAMLADGVFGDLRPVAIYALHTAPMEVGRLATAPGPTMAARDRLQVTIRGAGDQAAAERSVRQLLEAATTVSPSALFAPTDTSFVMIQPFGARTAEGVTTLRAAVTLASHAVREALRTRLTRELAALSRNGVEVALEYDAATIAGVTNDAALVRRGNAAIAQAFGDTIVGPVRTILPAFSEDFGSFQAQVPGVMWFLGVSNAARGTVGMPHAPNYVADEGAILVGARAMSAVLLERLSPSSRGTSGR